MSDRLFTWPALVVIVLLCMVGLVPALAYREQVEEWCKWAGNVATVGGLAVSVLGFALTIITLLDTQRVAREAERAVQEAAQEAERSAQAAAAEARKAMQEAKAENQRALDRIALTLLMSDLQGLARLTTSARDASAARQWHKAMFSCEAASLLAPILAGNAPLLDAERDLLAAAERSLVQVLRYIERRTSEEPPLDQLPSLHMNLLGGILRDLARIESRLRGAPWR
jgi:hypothetical protein